MKPIKIARDQYETMLLLQGALLKIQERLANAKITDEARGALRLALDKTKQEFENLFEVIE